MYSLGAMLYTLLTGSAPYARPGSSASPRDVLAAVAGGPPRPVQSVDRFAPAELAAICEKAMARSREARYASV